MLKNIITLLKKTVFSFLLLYGFNLVMMPLNLTIPINIITVMSIVILGFPSLLGFIVILLVLY